MLKNRLGECSNCLLSERENKLVYRFVDSVIIYNIEHEPIEHDDYIFNCFFTVCASCCIFVFANKISDDFKQLLDFAQTFGPESDQINDFIKRKDEIGTLYNTLHELMEKIMNKSRLRKWLVLKHTKLKLHLIFCIIHLTVLIGCL